MSKLYLLTQSENQGYDTYSDCVVCANNEDGARTIHPSSYYTFHDGKLWFKYADMTEREDNSGYDEWARPDKVEVKLIGTAKPNIKAGTVICASFHAG